ncbi:MAG: DUF935 family protein [Alphaproteobacteria bacterium]|nr:DUF935 family protein [Alphaproteobacteria bacterium]MDD9919767.1 DUF935 family protein [Alphaproteobacteria bacterium]
MTDDTKQPKPVTNEIASVKSDPEYAFAFMGRLTSADSTLATRGNGKGYAIYDDIERDAHAQAVLQKRKMALVSYPWELTAASDSAEDKRARDLVEDQLLAMDFNQICLNTLDGLLKGFSVGEVMWKNINGTFTVTDIKSRDPNRFVFDLDSKLRIKTIENMFDGEDLPDRKFIVHSFNSKYENPYGCGLGSILFWPVFFKRNGIKFWLTFADKFGNPTAIGKYPTSASPEERRTLEDALAALSNQTGITMPEGMMLEFIEAKRSGTVQTYESLCNYMDKQISLAVLGETLSTDIGSSGSRAASETHNDVRLELTQGDGNLLAGTFNNSFIKWVTEVNLPHATPPILSWDITEQEDLNARAERDTKVYGMGFKPSVEYIQRYYGEEWTEDTKRLTTPQSAAFAEAVKETTDLKLANRLLDDTAQNVDKLIDPIQQLLNRAHSLEDFQEGLLNLYAELPVDELADKIADAMQVAELAGRFEFDDK